MYNVYSITDCSVNVVCLFCFVFLQYACIRVIVTFIYKYIFNMCNTSSSSIDVLPHVAVRLLYETELTSALQINACV